MADAAANHPADCLQRERSRLVPMRLGDGGEVVDMQQREADRRVSVF